MTLLITGLLLWSVVHLSLSITPNIKKCAIEKIGLGPYKGIFALLIFSSLALIIFGWRTAEPVFLYDIASSHAIRGILMLLAIIGLLVFFSAKYPNRLKPIIRHPQLIGLKIWALAHLLLNGDTRSIWLFGVLLTWAVLEVIFINKRDGKKPLIIQSSIKTELIGLIISLIVIGVIICFHQYIAGVAII